MAIKQAAVAQDGGAGAHQLSAEHPWGQDVRPAQQCAYTDLSQCSLCLLSSEPIS
jgi:hypothetical protein